MNKSFTFVMIAALLLAVNSVTAETNTVFFTEDMESPDVASYSEGTLPGGWVKATQGFGAGRVGLTDETSGDFISPDPGNNHQAIAFRYTNSGMTTDEGEIGDFFLHTTYTVTFDAAADFGRAAATDTYYRVQFMVMTNGTVRNDCRSNPAGSFELAARTGNAPTNGSYQNVSFTYSPHLTNDVGKVGMDLTVRIKASTSHGVIDNVTVSWIPLPKQGTIFLFH